MNAANADRLLRIRQTCCDEDKSIIKSENDSDGFPILGKTTGAIGREDLVLKHNRLLNNEI